MNRWQRMFVVLPIFVFIDNLGALNSAAAENELKFQ